MTGSLVRRSTVILAVVALAGCGSNRASVSGQVKLAGKPLSNATIYFQPERGPLAQSRLDEEGRYELTTPGVGNSVAPGTYRVYLAVSPSEADELAKSQLTEADFRAGKMPAPHQNQIPAGFEKYFSASKTDLVREVTAGSSNFDFDLTR